MPKTPHSSLNLSSMSLGSPSALRRSRCRQTRGYACLVAADATLLARIPPSARPRRSASRRAVDRADSPPTVIRIRSRRCGRSPAPARLRCDARCSSRRRLRRVDRHDDARRRFAEERRRDVQRPGGLRHRDGRSTRRRRCPCRCRSSTRRASTARPPSAQSCADRNQPPAASRDQQLLQRASRSRSSAGGTPRTMPCTTFRYSLPPSSPRLSPSRTIASPAVLERARHARDGVLDQADDAEHRRRIDRLAVGLVVEADVAAGDRDVQRAAGLADAFDRLGELPHDFRPLAGCRSSGSWSRRSAARRRRRRCAPPRRRRASRPRYGSR